MIGSFLLGGISKKSGNTSTKSGGLVKLFVPSIKLSIVNPDILNQVSTVEPTWISQIVGGGDGDAVGIAVGMDVGGGQASQSPGQVLQFSPLSHTPLPLLAVGGGDGDAVGIAVGMDVGGGQSSQSPGQVLQYSPLSHTPLPQLGTT